ncbi:MAG: TonB-dependent receptor, partial [Gammaproteobacteria bacterium]|nr:TonB-dependent receptor [Gammaproteobacteria bacterium]
MNSLSLLPTQTEDVERMEVVLGPGSALYGPNTANGVLHVLTKSPLDHQGTIASVMGGEREVASGSVRTSHLLTEDLGIKVSARYFQGREWEHTDPVELQTRQAVLPADPDTRIGLRDFDLMNWSVDARADWRISPELTAIVSGGQTKTDGIDLNGIGASQLMGWTYRYYQARANWRRAFAQVYMTESDAGETYNLRTGADYHDNSSLLVAQLQHGFSLGERQDFIYGLDYIGTRPDTRGTIHGDNEDRDDLTEFGGYLQSETSLGSRFDLVLAGRLDKHS